MYFLSIFLVDFDNLTWTLLDSKTHFCGGFVDDSRRAEQVKPDLGFPVDWALKGQQGHRHKSRALVRENVKM